MSVFSVTSLCTQHSFCWDALEVSFSSFCVVHQVSLSTHVMLCPGESASVIFKCSISNAFQTKWLMNKNLSVYFSIRDFISSDSLTHTANRNAASNHDSTVFHWRLQKLILPSLSSSFCWQLHLNLCLSLHNTNVHCFTHLPVPILTGKNWWTSRWSWQKLWQILAGHHLQFLLAFQISLQHVYLSHSGGFNPLITSGISHAFL